MAAQIITKEDLDQFKVELLDEFKELLESRGSAPERKWVKSYEVREMLGLSPGTLQNMRNNGTLPYTKMGGLIFYDMDDINRLLEENQRNGR